MRASKNILKLNRLIDRLIKEEIGKINEAEPPEPDISATPDSNTDDSSSDDSSTDDAGEGDGLDLDGDSGSNDDGSGDTDGLDVEDDSGGLDLDSGGGGGLGGLGGGGGGSFDFGDDSSSDDSGDSDGDNGSGADEITPETGDPISDTITLAKDLLKTTSDQNRILAALKAKIQTSFSDWSEAEQIVYDLWNTEDPTLKIVASKLLMFIDQD